MRKQLHTKFVTSMDFVDSPQMGDSNKDNVVDNVDGLQLSTLVEEETRDVITNLLNQVDDRYMKPKYFANRRSCWAFHLQVDTCLTT